jgi:glycosyltransferase involved in cell wall biosynthesis
MRVVHINTSASGGAGIAARRLVQAQLKNGVRAAFLSRSLTIDFDGDEWNDPFFDYNRPPLIDRIAKRIGFIKTERPLLDEATRKLESLRSRLSFESASIPYTPFKLEEHPLVEQADVIHLHWVGQILDYPSFFENCKKPIVWTLHDMNPFMGLFHYRQDLLDNERHVSPWDEQVLAIKKQAYANVKKGAIVSPSKWLLQEAQNSGVLASFTTFRTIPNCIDTTVFTPKNKQELRAKMGIEPEANVFLFSANALDIPRKGASLLTEALDTLTVEVTILTQGKGALETGNPKVKIIPLGHSNEVSTLVDNYSIADAFLLPSLEDNLPNTMLEAMACGLPVIGFATGGIKEHILENRNGKLVSPATAAQLKLAIERFCVSKAIYVEKTICGYASDTFGERKTVAAYNEVYKRLTN